MDRKLTISRTDCQTIVLAYCEGNTSYTYIARKDGGFSVGGSTPFASPIAAAKFARRVLKTLDPRRR